MLRGLDDRWLDQANASDLEALARALDDQRLVPPFTAAQVQRAGLHASASGLLTALCEGPEAVPVGGLVWMLRRLARERREAERRWSDVATLVWSGPSEGHEPTRDTRVVLGDLFARAEHHVLLATYAIHDGLKVFAPLVRRMQARPALAVDFYVHLPSQTGADEDEAADASAFVADFMRLHWPPGVRRPDLYYDPATRLHGPKRTSLHAKCVVIDERWAFVTSANFTEAAQARNIEAGVLLDHPALASALAGRFRSLREAGRMRIA